jgi:hypothetical protein
MNKFLLLFYAEGTLLAELEAPDLPGECDLVQINYTTYEIKDYTWVIIANDDASANLKHVRIDLL